MSYASVPLSTPSSSLVCNFRCRHGSLHASLTYRRIVTTTENHFSSYIDYIKLIRLLPCPHVLCLRSSPHTIFISWDVAMDLCVLLVLRRFLYAYCSLFCYWWIWYKDKLMNTLCIYHLCFVLTTFSTSNACFKFKLFSLI